MKASKEIKDLQENKLNITEIRQAIDKVITKAIVEAIEKKEDYVFTIVDNGVCYFNLKDYEEMLEKSINKLREKLKDVDKKEADKYIEYFSMKSNLLYIDHKDSKFKDMYEEFKTFLEKQNKKQHKDKGNKDE